MDFYHYMNVYIGLYPDEPDGKAGSVFFQTQIPRKAHDGRLGTCTETCLKSVNSGAQVASGWAWHPGEY